MVPTKLLIWKPDPLGLPVVLTGAHLAVHGFMVGVSVCVTFLEDVYIERPAMICLSWVLHQEISIEDIVSSILISPYSWKQNKGSLSACVRVGYTNRPPLSARLDLTDFPEFFHECTDRLCCWFYSVLSHKPARKSRAMHSLLQAAAYSLCTGGQCHSITVALLVWPGSFSRKIRRPLW